MKGKSESPEFIQGSFFDQHARPFEINPEIAFAALQQIQRLRASNKKKDAISIIEEWII